MNVGSRLAEILRELGVHVLFGVPGGQTLPLYQASRASGMTHVLMRDERSAACAADAYARVTGGIGVCDATVGPGATNLVSGLAEALASSVPVLAVVADIRSDQSHLRRRSNASQACSQAELLAPVCKWVGRVDHAGALDAVVDQALRVATTGRPGPVLLGIPEDLWTAETAASRSFGPAAAASPRFRPEPDRSAAGAAARVLAEASRPVVFAGGGVIASGASEALTRFAAARGIPVVTSINGKGAVDERLPVAAGVTGLFGSARALRALDGADAVLVLGSKLAQMSTHGWRLPRADQHVVHVDIDGEEIGRSVPAAVGIVADARATLGVLEELVPVPAVVEPWFDEPPLDLHDLGELDDPGHGEGIDPRHVMAALDRTLRPDDVVVCDASYSSGWAAAHLRVAGGRGFLAPRGLAGLGWSPGAAVGAAFGAGLDRRVVVVAGDGGFAYSVAEIETAARYELDVTYVILNNSALAWINHGEERMGMPDTSTFRDVDFARVAEGFGATGTRARSVEDVDRALGAAAGGPGPFLLDVVTHARSAPTVSLRSARGETRRDGRQAVTAKGG